MIIDCHTHIFPSEVIDQREHYAREDSTFRLLYGNPKARLATAADLLGSMEAAGIDVSVALGFAWQRIETVRLHNDYLLDASAQSNGRIVAFCSLPLADGADATESEMRRCIENGALGFGELRPDNLGFDLNGEAGAHLADVARELGSALLFHVSEPVGHAYAGKEGLDLGAFYRFVTAHPGLRVIGAHWGGGLPFYTAMPEVRTAFEGALSIDTAASSLLYDDAIYEHGVALIGAGHVLFGSDYPLLSQRRSKRRIEESGLDVAAKARILGENAAQLLGLP